MKANSMKDAFYNIFNLPGNANSLRCSNNSQPGMTGGEWDRWGLNFLAKTLRVEERHHANGAEPASGRGEDGAP